MAGAESPGERTGDFSLLDQANNNFLENFIKVKNL